MTADLIALHMGQLHAYEQYLVFTLAFGPFVLLGIVVFFVRRRDVAQEQAQGEGQAGAIPATDPAQAAPDRGEPPPHHAPPGSLTPPRPPPTSTPPPRRPPPAPPPPCPSPRPPPPPPPPP